MKRILCLCVVLATVGLVACSKGTSVPAGSEATPAEAASPTNTTAFPLYQGANVVSSKQFTQTVAGNGGTGMMSQGAGTYAGNEVIAGSNASLTDLENWLRQEEKQPPSGYVAVAIPANMASIHTIATKHGMDFAMFQEANNKKHGIVVLAMDPTEVHAKLGAAMGLISKYQSLPEMMRNPVDAQLKQRFGYSASEFVAPGSPLGSAVGAVNQFHNNNQRAIVIIDVTKQ